MSVADRETAISLIRQIGAGGGGIYVRTGMEAAAEALAVDMATSLDAETDADTPDLISLRGSLLLLAAVIAARRTDRSATD